MDTEYKREVLLQFMKLFKFKVVSIDIKDYMTTFYLGLDFTKEFHEKAFIYAIVGDDGNTYTFKSRQKKMRIPVGKEIRCFGGGYGLKDNQYNIKYSRQHGGYFIDESTFNKLVDQHKARNMEQIEWYKNDIARLEKLKTPSPENV